MQMFMALTVKNVQHRYLLRTASCHMRLIVGAEKLTCTIKKTTPLICKIWMALQSADFRVTYATNAFGCQFAAAAVT
jgi:hypothetical protein